jgi:hypothetical protein
MGLRFSPFTPILQSGLRTKSEILTLKERRKLGQPSRPGFMAFHFLLSGQSWIDHEPRPLSQE